MRTPVGEVSVLERVLETGAVLGGEGNGGVILPSVNPTRDGLVAAAAVLALLAPQGAKLSDIRKRLPHYEMVKTTVPVSRDEFAVRTPQLLAGFAGARVDTQDGLRLDGADYWVHVRPSNTEPLVRIIAEAGSKARAEEAAQQARTLLAEGKFERRTPNGEPRASDPKE
jgi:phosphomannomutase